MTATYHMSQVASFSEVEIERERLLNVVYICKTYSRMRSTPVVSPSLIPIALALQIGCK